MPVFHVKVDHSLLYLGAGVIIHDLEMLKIKKQSLTERNMGIFLYNTGKGGAFISNEYRYGIIRSKKS